MSAIHVPGHQVVEVLGRGRFGVVHRARRDGTGREVAIRIDTRRLPDEGARQRFLRELGVARRLSGHPHVVETYDGGVLPDGHPYLVMELCPGGSLADRAPMPPREVAEVGQQLADALATAHDLGVLHGDVKPGNVLVKAHGTVGLADFGLGAVTGETLVTPAYAAPETRDGPPTARADVYSLAATLHALLAGVPPRLPLEDLPGVPAPLMAVLRRGLAEDPARRYADAAALRADLSQLTVGDLDVRRPAADPPAASVASSASDDDDVPPRPARPSVGEPERDQAPGRRVRLTAVPVVIVLVIVLGVLAVVWFVLVGR